MISNALGTLMLVPSLLRPWYETNARALPWRDNREPYHVWLSEVMLQQTRVEAVKPYYIHFLHRLPTIRALATCEEATLLKLWEGLGYYSRVRNLSRAAMQIMERYDGVFPRKYEDILLLPGIGDYTAGAIASICFGLPEPAVDGNVLRVVSRICADARCVDEHAVKQDVRTALRQVYDDVASKQGDCGVLTQSLMELGATVCVPNGAPQCAVCPCQSICEAHAAGKETDFPVRKRKKARKIQYYTVYTLRCGDWIAVAKRGAKGLLAGMWELPHMDGKLNPQEAIHAAEEWHCVPTELVRVAERVHIFTHIEWHMSCVYLLCAERPDCFQWVSLQQLEKETALPTAFRVALPDFQADANNSFTYYRRGVHMEWSIRAASASDIDALVQMRIRQLASEGQVATCDLTDALYTYYQEVLTTGAQTLLVAVCEDQLIANGGISYVYKSPYYANPTGKIGVVFSMFTEEPFRRQGLASAILRKLLKLAKQRGCGEIYVTASNMGVPFYESLGFTANPNFRHLLLSDGTGNG